MNNQVSGSDTFSSECLELVRQRAGLVLLMFLGRYPGYSLAQGQVEDLDTVMGMEQCLLGMEQAVQARDSMVEYGKVGAGMQVRKRV